MEQELKLRAATKADAAALAVLVDIAGEGLPVHLWSTLCAPGQSILELGRERAARKEGGFYYRNASIAALDDEVAAILIGHCLDDPYDLSDLDAVPEVVPLVKLEAKVPGSWYVNVLATFPEFRRQGIARMLFDHAEAKAKETGGAFAERDRLRRERTREAPLRRRRLWSTSQRAPVHVSRMPHGGHWLLMVKTLKTGG